MRIVVVGLGSMGQRRIRLLERRFGIPAESIIGVDQNENKRKHASEEYGISTAEDLSETLLSQDLDAAFVCTGPASHGAIINACLKSGLHVFSEINLIDTLYDENIELAKQQGKILFLSSTGMYRPEVAYIKTAVQKNSVAAYCYHIGQYLPDWHPWEDYREMFLAHPETNACREILAIELPWLIEVFGPVCSYSSLHRKSSSLDIDYDDTFSILLEHESGIAGTLTVDVVSRNAVRNFECFGEGAHIIWDGSPTGLMSFDLDKKELSSVDLYRREGAEQLSDYAAFVVEDAYAAEIEEFFSAMGGGHTRKVFFRRGQEGPRHRCGNWGMTLRFLIVGYGSMGQRHARNLRKVCKERGLECSIDLLRHQSTSVPKEIDAVYNDKHQLTGRYDAILITNPTALHYETLLDLIGLSNAFFIEKPVFERTDHDLRPLLAEEKVFYVAAPMHYKPAIVWLKENFDFSDAFSLRSISSSYLPEWRPGVDYRQTYSAHKDMGGGVSIDLIHECDYLQYLIGFPKKVHAIIERRSNLEIDSDDIALYIADYGDKTVEIHLDYFGRVPMRKLEIFTAEDTVECDLLTDTISFLKSGETIALTEKRDDTQIKELEAFLDMAQGKKKSTNDIEHAIRTLIFAKGYER